MAFLVPSNSSSLLKSAMFMAGATALTIFAFSQLDRRGATSGYEELVQVGTPPAPPAQIDPIPLGDRPISSDAKVQMAILLDTSSSMSGLIDQARGQLWRIVNEVGRAQIAGERPALEIAIYEYGNSSLSPGDGYIRQVLGLTSDLDTVSEALFSLTTSGGSEHAGQVIARAHHDLAWSDDPNALRLVYIAGNETFEQGPIDFRQAIGAAKDDGLLITTIHCGNEEQGARDLWAEAAMLADGRYLAIDHNAAVVHIDAPQDAEIARLGAALNDTYVYYGRQGRSAYENQMRQDNNAGLFGIGSSAQRAVSKSSGMYRNDHWDLVDGVTKGGVSIDEIERDTLPPELEGLGEGEIAAVVNEKAKQRGEIQSEIAKLERERREYVEAKRAEMADDGTTTLDEAILESLREPAAERGFIFE